MKNDTYQVYFIDGKFETVYASCVKAAEILAQAKRIKECKSWTITQTIKLDSTRY